MMRISAFTLTVSLLASLAACDPCSGIVGCSAGAYLSASGQVVDQGSGRGVDGVVIDLVRTGGIGVGTDSIRVVTHDGGFWRVELSPSEPGTVTVDVIVTPLTSEPYRVRGLELATREHGGDANLNERWISRPYFNHFGEFFLRGSVDDRAQNVLVEFRRTGGGELRGPGIASGVYSRVTDAAGRYRIFPYAEPDSVLPVGGDAVLGDLTLHLGDALGVSVIHGFSVTPSYVYREPSHIDRYPVGPSLGFVGEVRDAVSHNPVAGVEIRFERTGGIPVSLGTFTATTNAEGHFDFPLVRALAAGTLLGRMIFLAAPATRPETLQVALPTFDADNNALPPFYIAVTTQSPSAQRSAP
jgi:hypothetical protein